MATTALQKKQSRIINAFANNVDTLVQILPPHVSPGKLMRTLSFEIRQNPKLAECTTVSLMGAVIKACLLGLEVGSAKGHAYLVPFKGEATMQIGYKGFVWLAHNSKKVRKVEARAVFDGDHFRYAYGTDPFIEHVPDEGADVTKDANVTHVYAVVYYSDGSNQFDVMTRDATELIRQKAPSASAKSSPWKSERQTDIIEMRKKTVLRRLCKLVPLSEMQEAATLDEAADDGRQDLGSFLEGEFNIVNEGDADEPEPATGNERGKAALKNKETDAKKPPAGKKPANSPSEQPGPEQNDLVGDPTLFEQLEIKVNEADTLELVNKALDAIKDSELSDEDRAELEKRAHAKAHTLTKETT